DSGLGLLEIYTIDGSYDLRNLSLRGYVGSGIQTLVGGFVITDLPGSTAKATVLLRAVGPTLADFGVSGALMKPRLEVFDAAGKSLARVERWGDTTAAGKIITVSAQVGAFPLNADLAD